MLLRELGVNHASSVYIESTLSKGRELLNDFGVEEHRVTEIANELRAELIH